MDKKVNILHPLSTLHWEECRKLPEGLIHTQCVLLNDRVYVCGENEDKSCHKIFISSNKLDSWTVMATPTSDFGLTTYHSELVLVGGKEMSTNQITNKLWTLDKESDNWLELLPSMPTTRSSPAAVTTVNPQRIIVAGGTVGTDEANEQVTVDIVEVFSHEQWTTVQPLPAKNMRMLCAFHNGSLFVTGDHHMKATVYHCKVGSITDSLQIKTKEPTELWDQFKIPPENHGQALISFGQQLVTIGGVARKMVDDRLTFEPISKLVTHSPLSQHVHFGDLPIETCQVGAVVLTTGDLAVIGGLNHVTYSDRVFKTSLKASSYHPDGAFSNYALNKLEEGTGIKILKYLGHEQVVSTGATKCKTWRTLLDTLREQSLDDLVQQIEDVLISHDFQVYASFLSAFGRNNLEQTLDWDHEGQETDLHVIANMMLEWEKKLTIHLGLTEDVDGITKRAGNLALESADMGMTMEDMDSMGMTLDDFQYIGEEGIDFSAFQRQEALRSWQRNLGPQATYGNLLKSFIKAGHTKCAEVVCEVLKKRVPDFQYYASTLLASVRPYLEQELDWDHDGKEKDLKEIVDMMLDWEEELSVHLGLTDADRSDINTRICSIVLQSMGISENDLGLTRAEAKKLAEDMQRLKRLEDLKKWQQKQGTEATYGNLLKCFIKAGCTKCAEAVCKVLRRKSEVHSPHSICVN